MSIPFMESKYEPEIIMNSDMSSFSSAESVYAHRDEYGFQEIDDIQLPLHIELGINFSHIRGKTFAALNPFSLTVSDEILTDCDIAGPVCFSLLFGVLLLLGQKWTFDYIYGISVVGCIGIYFLLNMMSDYTMEFYSSVSILGYSILPLLILAIVSLFVPLHGFVGFVVSTVFIIWATHSATSLFTQLLRMRNQRLLISYPVALYYLCFALLTIF